MKKTTIRLFVVMLLAIAPAAVAQSLQTYFNFTTYGTQSGGAALADLTGNTTATLNTEAHTILTSSGLTISSGGSSLSTGVTIDSAAMSGFTGAFSIQQWVTLAAVNNNQVLFGANNGDVNTYVGDGATISTVIGAIRSQAFSAYVGGSTPSYVRGGYGVADATGTPSTATLYDVVLTFDGTSFREYVNGTLKGTLNMPTFGSLAQACSADSWTGKSGFAIGGGMNDPFTDTTLPATTRDFLLYNGALSQSQITSIHNLGAGASLSAITNALAPSANTVWSGGGSDNTWTNGANWVSGYQPNAGDFVTFAGTTQTNVNLVASFSLGSLTFSNNAGSFTITNSSCTLTLAGGLTNNSANPQTVAVPVAFGGAQTINAAAGNVALTGGVAGSGLTIVGNGRTVTLSGANTYTGNLAILGSSVLVLGNTATQTNSGVVTGTGTLVKSGAGTLVLAGANNFTGTTTVSNGTLLVIQASGQSLGTNITVVGGATFGVMASADASYLSPAKMTVGTGSGATLQFGIAGTNNAPLKPTTLTLSGTTTINITQCPYALTNFPLITGYTSGTLVLGSQPTGWTGQLTVSGGTVYYKVTSLDPNLKPFVHPGCLSTLADLQRMKAKVQAGLEPWASGYAALANNVHSQNNYVAYPHPTPCRGNTCATQDYLTMCRDANAAYQAALRYWVTGDSSYADCAIRNMDGYANTVITLEGDSNCLLMMGAQGFQWACAAELLRNYQPWIDSGGFANFKNFLLTKFYIQPTQNGLHAFLQSHNNACPQAYWLNWDLFAMDAVAAIGVVCDRRDIYNEAINYYQSGQGNGNAHNALWFMHPGYLGQSQEIGRDAGHSSADAVLLGQFCEVAWNQGDDMYGYNNNTLLAISEYTDNMMTTWWNTPWVNYASCAGDDVQVAFGTQYRPGADLIWNHYVNRKGLAAPFTMPWAIAGRPENGGGAYGEVSGGYDQIGFTTLTHALDPITNSPAPSGVVADARNANQALVWWWGSAYATSYKVKRSTSINGPFTQVGTVAGNWTLLFTDYCLTPGTTYYYVVSAVVNGVETTNSLPANVLANQRLTGWVIGTSGTFTYGQGIAQLFDNAPITYFDGPDASGDWGGLDLSSSNVITKVGYYPRAGFAGRMTGGQFQGCNVADFSSGVVTLYTIGSQPADGTTTVQSVSNPTAFRYVRYIGPDNGYCNAAEIQFQGYPSPVIVPSAPTGVAVAMGNATMTLMWNWATGVTGYNIKRSTTPGGPYTGIATNFGMLTFTDTNVVNLNAYYYVVSALNAAGESPDSSEVGGTLLPQLTGTIIGSAGGYTTSTLKDKAFDGDLNTYYDAANGSGDWAGLDLGSGAAVKVVQIKYCPRSGYAGRMVGGQFQGCNVADFSSGVVTLFTVASQPADGVMAVQTISNTNIFRYLRYIGPDGGYCNVAEVAFFGSDILWLAPDGLTADPGAAQVVLRWNAVNGATSYNVKRSTVSGGSYTNVFNVSTAGFTNTGLANFTTYYYVVSIVAPNGEGPDSFEVSATPFNAAPSAPVSLTAAPGDVQVRLNWSAAPSARAYKVKRSTTSGGGHGVIATTTTTNYTDTAVTNGVAYYYVVSATNSLGEGANSTEASATPAAPVRYTNDFSVLPLVTEWVGGSVAGGAGDLTNVVALHQAATNLNAADFTAQFGTSTNNPPAAANSPVWCSSGGYLQTCPTGVRFQVMIAKLVNDTGADANTLTVSYDFRQGSTNEEVDGWLTYYSVAAGVPGSWRPIYALWTNAPGGRLSATVILESPWSNSGTLCLLWVDDNGSPSPDTGNQMENFSATATMVASPVAIITQPASALVLANMPASFSVAVAGSTPHYRWYHGSTPVGTDSATYAIASAQPGDAGDYFVMVSNNFNRVTSTVATLVVTQQVGWVAFNNRAPPPANVTAYSPDTARNGPFEGLLRNVLFGNTLPAFMSFTTNVGATGNAGTMGAPLAGTPADTIFSAHATWTGTNAGYNIRTTGEVAIVFTGLNPAKTYKLAATAVRGGGSGDYSNRWTQAELVNAVSYTVAHTPGVLTSAQWPALTAGQAALNTGLNITNLAGEATGDVFIWNNIVPAAGPGSSPTNGTFTVLTKQYTHGTPYMPSGITPVPAYAYGLSQVRLEEYAGAVPKLSITVTSQNPRQATISWSPAGGTLLESTNLQSWNPSSDQGNGTARAVSGCLFFRVSQ